MLIVEQSTHSAAHPDNAGRYQPEGYENRADSFNSKIPYYDFLAGNDAEKQPMIMPENGFNSEEISIERPYDSQIDQKSNSSSNASEIQYAYKPQAQEIIEQGSAINSPEQQQAQTALDNNNNNNNNSASQQSSQATPQQSANSANKQQPRSPIGTASGNNNFTNQQQATPHPAVRFASSTDQQQTTHESTGRFMSAVQREEYLAQQQQNANKENLQSEGYYSAYNLQQQAPSTSRYQSQSTQQFQPAQKQFKSTGTGPDGYNPSFRSIGTGPGNNFPSRNLAADTNRLIGNLTPPDLTSAIKQADKLIEQSYFSPEMQYAVLACVGRPFKVNVVTGKVSEIPIVTEILSASYNSNIDAKIRRNALHAALEAVQVARFYAKLNIAYDNPAYVFFAPTLSSNRFLMPSLDENLELAFLNREEGIQDAIKTLNESEGYSFIWSWIPTDLVNMFSITPRGLTSQAIQESKLEFNADVNNLDKNTYPGNFVTITGNTIKDLIKNFDYKQKVNVQEATNLLFKQCFIAQQAFPTEDWPLFCTPLGSAVNASNYIFDRFEVTRTKIMKQDNSPFLQVNTQSINPTHAKNIDELCGIISTSADTPPHNRLQAHLLFLRIRKAIQTAMYIANKNSNFYAGYILPPAITKYLDGIVNQLIIYDRKLSILCKDQKLGATKDDLLRDKIWTNITGVATGLGIIAAGFTAIDYVSGAGTSAKLAETTAESATYYGGKAVVNTAYYGTTIPLQAAASAVAGTIAGAQGVVSGAVKGAQDFMADYGKKPETLTPASQNAPAEKAAQVPAESPNPTPEIVTTAQPAV